MAESDNESRGHNNASESSTREQDRFLPIANVSRIIKKGLPANAKISKDAKETVQECVSEFISFITGEASDKCQREKRKTINGDDLLWAMTTLGFEDYIDPLKIYLQKYREMEGEKIATTGGCPQGDHRDGSAVGGGGVRDHVSSGGEFAGGGIHGGIQTSMIMMIDHHQHHLRYYHHQQHRHMYGSGGGGGSSSGRNQRSS
ncbi:hypothetical protein K2173_011046 [Erythroxylum novogranatense]|uniref:Transcription factor CBF/NF-Y/archaeal histone domain-containing protein n=1 Tax=Erythroxylum novogranatense TaxID=1862640 RepID=A0AAV8T1P8_9ROSI|nr:hypothetical protein K2173_011046 [Erythroxylum novogranatense]